MQIEIIKGAGRDDTVRITRSDGSIASAAVPKKGPLPHDAVHVIVESELAFRAGFIGLIAAGRAPGEIASFAAAMGHSSARKAHTPDASIVELIQAERLVECFEAEAWGKPADLETLQSVADAGFAESLVPRIVLTEAGIGRIRARLDQLKADWLPLEPGAKLTFIWDTPAGGGPLSDLQDLPHA